MLTGLSFSESSIWCPTGEIFGYEWAVYQPANIILRPKILSQVHMIKIEGLRTCVTSLESSHRTKSMVSRAILCIFHGHCGYVRKMLAKIGRLRLCSRRSKLWKGLPLRYKENEMVQRQRLFKVPCIARHNNPLTNIHCQIFGRYFRSGVGGSESKCWALWTGNGRKILLSPKMGPLCGQICNLY